jgi:glycosyltransferase A (GT-A) superfamily protein (DUF2064 family)
MLLIIFVKNSVLGKVKTRIANEIGDESAVEKNAQEAQK